MPNVCVSKRSNGPPQTTGSQSQTPKNALVIVSSRLARDVLSWGSTVNDLVAHDAGRAFSAGGSKTYSTRNRFTRTRLDAFRDRLTALAQQRVSARLALRQSPSDIVQETLLHAHRDLGQFRGHTEREFWSWLRQILIHRIQGAVRRHMLADGRDCRREVRIQARASQRSAVAVDIEAGHTSPSGRVHRKEQRTRIRVMLATLPGDYRRVLLLRIVSELPFEAISQQLDRSCAATRQLYQRARRALLEQLERHEAS